MKSYEDALKRQSEAKNTLQEIQDMCSGMQFVYMHCSYALTYRH